MRVQFILAARAMEKSYFKCLFLGWFPKCIITLQLTSSKLASAGALLKASNFSWDNLRAEKEKGLKVSGKTGSQRRPQAMESDRCGFKSWLSHLLAV